MLHDVGNRLRFCQLAKDMHLVGSAANDESGTLRMFQHRGQISVCSLAEVVTDPVEVPDSLSRRLGGSVFLPRIAARVNNIM